MQVYPITQSTGADTNTTSTTPVTNATKTLGVNDFLKLLAVQMNSQDPLNPTQDTQFIAQMASFTSLEQMKDLSSSMTSFIAQQKVSSVQSFLGKTVTLQDADQGSVSGTVTGISFDDGDPKLIVNGRNYDPAYLISIQQAGTAVPAATAAASSTTSAATTADTTAPSPATTTP